MKQVLRRAAIAVLLFANRIIPDPDTPRAARPQARSDFSPLFKRREPTLDYAITQQELSHIFRIESDAYQAAVGSRSVEIRELAGYAYTGTHQEVHGFGATQVLYNDKQLNIFVNRNKSGVFSGTGNLLSRFNNMMSHVYNTVSNLPKALLHARKFEGLVSKAHDHEAPGALCEIAIVAQKPTLSDDPRRVIFTIQAEHMLDRDKESPVILRNIFKPVVQADGSVSGMERIDPRDPQAQAEVLRFLIFAKLVMNQALSKQIIDIAGNYKVTADLPLDNNSRLRDYIAFQPPA